MQDQQFQGNAYIDYIDPTVQLCVFYQRQKDER